MIPFKIVCLISPEPNISWIGPRNTLLIGSRFLLTEFETQLQISNITASDEGDYSCIGSNVEGNITHTLRIRVGGMTVVETVKTSAKRRYSVDLRL